MTARLADPTARTIYIHIAAYIYTYRYGYIRGEARLYTLQP